VVYVVVHHLQNGWPETHTITIFYINIVCVVRAPLAVGFESNPMSQNILGSKLTNACLLNYSEVRIKSSIRFPKMCACVWEGDKIMA